MVSEEADAGRLEWNCVDLNELARELKSQLLILPYVLGWYVTVNSLD
jgi:hypothetical protein